MKDVYIALGANLGKPTEAFSGALEMMRREGLTPTAISGAWQSPAWPPGSGAPDYNNAVTRVMTELSPHEVLKTLLRIESEFGRERSVRNAPRTLDLDLIAYAQELVAQDDLSVPHPRLQDRAFVLLPLSQIAPNFRHPLTGQGLEDMLGRLPSTDVLAMRYLGQVLALSRDSH
jgi:2-amino-4-hydroxy-6-hydroxymethyldihydropteridine diphosphokinase